MNEKDNNLLSLKKYHAIYSVITNRIYIDKECRCYLFESDREAVQFCSQIENTEYGESRFLKPASFISTCYGSGIKRIRIKLIANENYQEIPVEKNDARKYFYNPEAEKNILRLLQTNKKKYLKELADVLLISPILIDKREAGEYPVIRYSYAIIPNSPDEKYYVLFTTLKNFETWNDMQNKMYSPSQTSLQDLNKIRGDNPVIINPLTDNLILTHKQVSSIIEEDT